MKKSILFICLLLSAKSFATDGTFGFTKKKLTQQDKQYLRSEFIDTYSEQHPDFERLCKLRMYAKVQILLGGRNTSHEGNVYLNKFIERIYDTFDPKIDDYVLISAYIYELMQEFNIGVRRFDHADNRWFEISRFDSIKFILAKYQTL